MKAMTLCIIVTPAILVVTAAAGAPAGSGTVLYKIIDNGRDAPEEGRIELVSRGATARIRTLPAAPLIASAPEEAAYLDYASGATWRSARFRDGTRATVSIPFGSLPKLEIGAERAKVAGYSCVKATTTIRSNRIEVWFTRDAGFTGTASADLVVPGGLVLKIVRNGNHTIMAERVSAGEPEMKGKAGDRNGDRNGEGNGDRTGSAERAATASLLPPDWGEMVDLPEYRARLAAAYVTTVPVFTRERICFGKELADSLAAADSKVERYAGGTVIVRKIELPEAPDAAVFADIVEASSGDAYDRTGSIFAIPAGPGRSFLDALRGGIGSVPAYRDRDGRTYAGVARTGDYAPPLELVRFITPFGIRAYNEQVRVRGISWEDSAVYRMEVTDLLAGLSGPVWIGAFIGNYDRGGHLLSLSLEYHAGSREAASSEPPRRWVLPLFNTVNVMESAGQESGRMFLHDSLRVSFEVPEGVRDLRLRYITTGHGGWDAGDEFTPRVNEILLDGSPVARFVPWRSDCAGLRRYNPASGNFWNGLSSSDFSRSGWCPGAAVGPMTIPLGSLAPGKHTLTVSIPMGAPEGESWSAWNVSGALLGEFAAPAPSKQIRAMSFNLRYGTAADGENSWEKRREALARTIAAFAPDVLATQECLAMQADWLKDRFPEYAFVGVGRDDGARAGEMCGILYKQSRFRKVAEGHFWLSPTPEKPGSVGWDAALTRMATWVRLESVAGRDPLVVIDTHFDHAGAEARRNSAVLLAKKAREIAHGDPVVILGDFNAPADPAEDGPYRVLAGRSGTETTGTETAASAAGTLFTDTYRALHDDFRASYLVADQEANQGLCSYLDSDPRFARQFEDRGLAIYQLR